MGPSANRICRRYGGAHVGCLSYTTWFSPVTGLWHFALGAVHKAALCLVDVLVQIERTPMLPSFLLINCTPLIFRSGLLYRPQ